MIVVICGGRRDGRKAAAVLQDFEPLDDVEVDRRHPAVGVDEAASQRAGERAERVLGDGRERRSARHCSSAAVKPTSNSRRHRLALVQSST